MAHNGMVQECRIGRCLSTCYRCMALCSHARERLAMQKILGARLLPNNALCQCSHECDYHKAHSCENSSTRVAIISDPAAPNGVRIEFCCYICCTEHYRTA